jgi:hypothetical protein
VALRQLQEEPARGVTTSAAREDGGIGKGGVVRRDDPGVAAVRTKFGYDVEQFMAKIRQLAQGEGSLIDALVAWGTAHDDPDLEATARLVRHVRARELKGDLMREAASLNMVREDPS